MDLIKHCKLCENKLFDFKNGTRCALTNKKPSFTENCNKIKFNDNLKKETTEINLEYELVKRIKNSTYYNLIFYLIISILIMVSGYLLGKYAFEKGVISTLPLIIIAVGFFTLPLAFSPINKYNQNIKVAKRKKEELDLLIKKVQFKIYNIL